MRPDRRPAHARWAAIIALGCLLGAPRVPLVLANISLVAFRAEGGADRVELLWESATELNTVGYQIRRGARQEGPFQALPGSFVAARGGPAEGGSYRWTDLAVTPGQTYYYQLASVETDQTLRLQEPIVCATPGGAPCTPRRAAPASSTPRPSDTPRPRAGAQPSLTPTRTPRSQASARPDDRASATPRPEASRRPSATPRPTVGAAPAATAMPRAGATARLAAASASRPAPARETSPRPGTPAIALATAVDMGGVEGPTAPALGAEPSSTPELMAMARASQPPARVEGPAGRAIDLGAPDEPGGGTGTGLPRGLVAGGLVALLLLLVRRVRRLSRLA